MKVFLLVNEWSIDYEQDTNVDVYETLSAARNAMQKDLADWSDNNSFPDMVADYEGGDEATLYESGDYTRNHITWRIVEKEVERDNEIDNNNYLVSSVSTDDVYTYYPSLDLTDKNMLDIAREMHEYFINTDAYWDALYYAVNKVMFNK